MSQRLKSRGWLGVIVTIVVLAVLGIIIVWQSLAQSTNPDYQIRDQQSGVGDYYINLWSNPTPLQVGENELLARMTTIIGTPIDLSYLKYSLVPPDGGEPIETDSQFQEDGPGNDPVHAATVDLDQAGVWEITLRYSMGGPEINALFELEVEG